MISQVSKFKLLDRGFNDTLVLIPGWATDYRIFSALDLDYNYLMTDKFYPFNFNAELAGFLNKERIDKVSLFGWSLGGFLAGGFALKNPDRINELILISIRKKFERAALEEIKCQILKNKRAYLYKFYLECFSDSDKDALSWFKKNLLHDYIRSMLKEDLISGLDYLSKAMINAESLSAIKKMRFFHGLEDKIAPVKEAEEIKNYLPDARFYFMQGIGHLPHLALNFREIFYGR